MKLLNEESVKGRKLSIVGDCGVMEHLPESRFLREEAPALPEVSEVTIARHFSALERRSHGVNSGFYPLGSCTMKYNPKISTVFGDTWEDFIEQIEANTPFGVDIDYQLRPDTHIDLIDVYGNLWEVPVTFLRSGGYILFTAEIARNKRDHG